MKSVLVTGATGFVGRHTLEPLIEKGYVVHAIFSERKPLDSPSNINWYQLDLHNMEPVLNLLQEISPSHLLHLAWYTKPKEYWNSPINIKWLNSSINLLNAFIKVAGKRVVFVGTCVEYNWKNGYCQEFTTPCIPSGLYGRAKYSLYLLSEELIKQNKISFAWGRLFFLFGSHEYEQRLISSAIINLLNQKSFDVMNGYQLRDYMYVKDAADALVALLDTDVEGAVNIGSGQAIFIRDLISLISNKLRQNDLVKYNDQNVMVDDKVVADIKRLSEEIKWQPKYTLDAALDETIYWWKEHI